MANNPQISAAAKNAALDAITALFNVGGAGTMKFYTGSQPAGPGTALSGQTLLGTATLSATSFPAAASGVATANAVTDATGVAAGTATWARVASGAGTAVLDITVGTSGSDANLSTVTFSIGLDVAITSFVITHP